MKSLVVALLLLGTAASARAATITIKNVDTGTEGFNDPTPATPVGGNMGTTIGEQRMNVFKKVAQLWGDALVSSVPIVASASFAPLTCTANQIMLGQAAFTTSRSNSPGLPPNVWVPIALANALAGQDLNQDQEEIDAMFNGGLSQCSKNVQNWYYGLDGQAADDIDLLAVVLHEFGHGLGFASLIDPATGGIDQGSGLLDTFAQNVYDNATNKAWTDITADAERAASAQDPRHLVWSGVHVQRQMSQILALGSPTMTVTPAPAGLYGDVTEAEFGPYLAMKPVSGILKVGKLTSACGVSGSLTGDIVLFASSNQCPTVQAAFMAQQAGAVGALFEDPVGADPPYAVSVLPSIQDYGPVTIPAVSVSTHDLGLLSNATGSTMVALGAVADQHVGADPMGRTYLFASDPVIEASTLSHWDPLARPDLLMEPEIASKATHDQRMELAAFRDLGWHTVCGNGAVDSGEACDLGEQNGAAGSTCYADCTTASGPIAGSGSGGATGSGGSAAATGGTSGSGGTTGATTLPPPGTGGAVGLGTGGTQSGGTQSGGTSGGGSGGTQVTGSGGVAASGGVTGASGGSNSPGETGGSSSGCSCEMGGGVASGQGLSVMFIAALAMLRRRRLG